MQASPAKLRSLFTGCEPVSSDERDARWSKLSQQFPAPSSPKSPGKENQQTTVPASAFQSKHLTRPPNEDVSAYPVRPLAATPPRPKTAAGQRPLSVSVRDGSGLSSRTPLAAPEKLSQTTRELERQRPGNNPNRPPHSSAQAPAPFHSRTKSLPVDSPTGLSDARPLRVAREFDMLLVRCCPDVMFVWASLIWLDVRALCAGHDGYTIFNQRKDVCS